MPQQGGSLVSGDAGGNGLTGDRWRQPVDRWHDPRRVRTAQVSPLAGQFKFPLFLVSANMVASTVGERWIKPKIRVPARRISSDPGMPGPPRGSRDAAPLSGVFCACPTPLSISGD